ncbi:mitochondrial metalloendopeptidase OMA1 [Trifolium repens]|nr:mitochondrial metalloendopeptidase OMA1 [Trifolium repens]
MIDSHKFSMKNIRILPSEFRIRPSKPKTPGFPILLPSTFNHYPSDAYLATILAHEVAHIVARHCAEFDTRSHWFFFIHDMLNLFVTIDFAQRVLPLVKRLPFNRRLEMEADYIGLLLMAAAGYDPWLAPIVYEDIERIEASYKEFTLGGFLRSHPPGRKRAKALSRPKIMEEALTLYNNVRAKHGDES